MPSIVGNRSHSRHSVTRYNRVGLFGQARNGKGHKEGTLKDLEKAAELDPNSTRIKAQLQQL